MPTTRMPRGIELGGHQAGAAAHVEDGAHARGVGPPGVVEEPGPVREAGVYDEFVVDPCEP